MSQLNNDDIVKRIESRIDRLENKLDRYLEVTQHQEADIKWVKGYIKVSISLMIAIGAGLVSTLLKYITGFTN